VSLVTDILDRLSGIAGLKEKLARQDQDIEGMQRIMLEQQRDISELKGAFKALIALQGERRGG
jgi:uncharacterized coiled-coil protein SlyX